MPMQRPASQAATYAALSVFLTTGCDDGSSQPALRNERQVL
jgi:hypothetical protein